VKKPPDILNSKIKKIRIELPHYSFSHSASGDSPHAFIGRERSREKIQKVIEDSPDEPGVYLIAGNRGVGKTSLISWVINETSLRTKTKFTENLKYLIFLFLAVAGFQVITHFLLKKFPQYNQIIKLIWPVLLGISFITLCFVNSYRRNFFEQRNDILNKTWNCIKSITFGIISAFKELSYLINPYNPGEKTQFVFKMILVVCYTQIGSYSSDITAVKTFVFYFWFVFVCIIRRFVRERLRRNYLKYKKNEFSKKNIYDIENKYWNRGLDILFKISLLVLLFLPFRKNFAFNDGLTGILIGLPFILICIYVCFWCCIYLSKDIFFNIKCIFKIIFYDLIFNLFKKYIKNHNRLYLRINFGHKINNEKDILRLVTRTLSTEYQKYRHSFWRMLPWRAIALSFLLLFASSFCSIVGRQVFYEKLVTEKKLYNDSSQGIFKYPEKNDEERLKNAFPKKETLEIIKIVETEENTKDSTDKIKNTMSRPKISTKLNYYVKNIILTIDQLIFEITKIIKKIPCFFLYKYDRYVIKDKSDKPLNYLFWLSFFLMYLICVLLFRSTWINHFFATHRIITRRLKKLNDDITYSTEIENTINIKGGNINYGSEIGTKSKKSRNIADAREMEKELQDILNDIQRIPFIMCRPNIVIVFDELDKVEPSDTGSINENQQTKAMLFSINAARERQTEILRILFNMKYFLSTAKAKFIFIAGREMYDIHLADVSERNNYIGSIFNVVILVPSFLTDHHTAGKILPQESSIASLPEEFVCRRLIPYDYPVESYDLKNYRKYLEKEIYCKKSHFNKQKEVTRQEKIQKIIAVLQQFIIYLAHVSKGAPKKMIQLFESFIEIHIERDENENTLFIKRYHNSKHFLSFNYYKQYTLGIVAYLIMPVFYRLAESNIKEHSDKLLVSSLRFVDFLFKFHKNSFSWKHLDMSPEMLEVNRAPELKSIAVDLLNYLTQVHINKSNFSLSEYKFDGLISNEIFAMAKTDEVFSALFSFSLDEMLPLKKHYKDLLDNIKKEYQKEEKSEKFSLKYIDSISSLQGVIGDLYYYDDGLEEAEAYYKSAVQALRELENKRMMTIEQLYVYVRNMLRLGIIYEKRKQYDFAYMTYGELCEQIFKWLEINNNSYNNKNVMSIYKMTYEGLKILYLPFIAKLQILEKSHVGGIASKHLKQLDEEFGPLSNFIDHEGGRHLRAEYYSRIADILYYKNSDLKCKNNKNRKSDKEDNKCDDNGDIDNIILENCSCTVCYYYHKALSILLNLDKTKTNDENTVKILLCKSIKQLYDKEKQNSANYNMKYLTILARILSDWGNVFFSCDINNKEKYSNKRNKCYICDKEVNDTVINSEPSNYFLDKCKKYLESEEENEDSLSFEINKLDIKRDIAFAMYTLSSVAYRKASLYKRASFQLYKMLCLFKDYSIYEEKYINSLSKQAIHYLWYANDDLNVLELNKRKKDFDRTSIREKDNMPLHNLLVDTEVTRIRVLGKELILKSEINNKIVKNQKDLKKYYEMRITSPYRINYSIVARIYRLRLKSKVNYETYKKILEKSNIEKDVRERKFLLEKEDFNDIFENINCKEVVKDIFGEKYTIIQIFENLIADSIYCLIDIAQLIETMDETYLFPHSFIGSIHEHLSFWIRQYEKYEVYKKENPDKINHSYIEKYLKQYLDVEWRDLLSGYRENQRALSHYQKSLEMHSEGRAYHNMIDLMCYVRDDFNDRSDHFNIAEERHLIVNGVINEKINALKDIYKDSKLYDVDNYFVKFEDNE